MKLLYRTTVGLLAWSKNFDGQTFNASDWTAGGSAARALDGSSLGWWPTVSSQHAMVRWDAVASRTQVMFQARIQSHTQNTRLGIYVHGSNITHAGADLIDLSGAFGFSSSAVVREFTAGTPTNLDSLAAQTFAHATNYTLSLFANGNTVAGWDSFTTRAWAGTASNKSGGGTVGLYVNGGGTGATFGGRVVSCSASTDRYITVNGIQNADVVEVRNEVGTVLATATSSGSSVQVDMIAALVTGCYFVVVKRGGSDYAQFTVRPDQGYWVAGGDVYELDENVEVVPDAAYEWVQEATAIRHTAGEDRTYIAGITRRGGLRVAAYDHVTEEVEQSFDVGTSDAVDWHNSPALLVDAADRIWVFWSNHNTETEVHYRRSTSAEDISAWGSETDIAFSETCTYLQAFRASDGRLVVITRQGGDGSPGNTNDVLAVRYTTNLGSSWVAQHDWLEGGDWTYVRMVQHSDLDTIGCVAFRHRTEINEHDLYYFEIDLISGDITVPGGGGALANLYSGGALDPTSALKIYEDASGGTTAEPSDVNEQGEVLFVVWDNSDMSPADHKYVKVNRSTGSVGSVSTVAAIASAGAPPFYVGGSLGTQAVAIVPRYVGGDWQMWRYETPDNGASWTGADITADPDDDSPIRVRPRTVRLATGDPGTFVYFRATQYEADDFLEYSGDLVIGSYDSTVTYLITTAFISSTVALFGPSVPIPSQPTITPTATGPRSVQAVGSAYVSLGAGIAASEWRIATNSGMSIGLDSVTIEYPEPTDAPIPPEYGWPDLTPATTYWFDVRYRDELGNWSLRSVAVSETTDAEVGPNTPSIVAAATTPTTVALTSSPYSDSLGRAHVSTDWQIATAAGSYASPVNESIDDVDELTSETLAGLTAGTAYKARVRYRAEDGAYSAYSADYLFSTPTVPVNRPAKPTVTVDDIEQRTAILNSSAYSDPDASPHRSTQWYVSDNPGGGSFAGADRVLNFTTNVFLLSIGLDDLLQPSTVYWATLRHRAQDGDWSDWADWVGFTTEADPLGGQLLQIQRPRHGEPVRGSAVSVIWTPASAVGTDFELEYSGDLGATWLTLATDTASPYSWDVSGLSDGIYYLRIRGVTEYEESEWEYRILYVDNANLEAGGVYLFNTQAEDPMDIGDWDPAWQESGITWSIGVGGDVRFNGPGISTFESALTYQPAFEPRQVDVIGEVMIGSTGGSFPWQWFPEQCWAGVGVFAAGPVTGTGPRDGITATIYAIPINAYGTCETRGRGTAFLEVAVYENGTRIKSSVSAEGALGFLHFVNLFSGCNKVPRYGVRLRLTTIADLPNSRRRLRIQVSVTGRGITAPDGGWHYESTVETGLDCGFAAFTARQITTTRNPYRSFSNLTVIPYEYGSCSAPPTFQEPVEVETCPPPFFDLTIFADDDVTPLWGEVDEYGDIVEASFSTDPNHPRPWLRRWTAGAEHEVDPNTGGSNIGTLIAEVIDKRTNVCDQGTGFVTSYGGDEEGFSAYIGRRAVARERLTDGSVHIVQNGPISEVTLLDTMVTYRFAIASMREREVDVPLFDTQYETSVAMPYGPVLPYGFLGTAYEVDDRYFLPAAGVENGNFQELAPLIPGVTLGEIIVDEFLPTLQDILSLGSAKAVYDESGYVGHFFTDFVIRWRYPGDDDTEWRYLRDMPAEPGSQAFFIDEDEPVNDQLGRLAFVDVIRMNAFTADNLLPNTDEDIEFQVLANNEPSESFPLYWEGNMGTLLRLIYDGAFSPESPAILYDEACMAAMEAVAPWARIRITEAKDDLRSWVEANIYQAIGWLPGLTEDGRICPIDATLPDPDEILLTLDNAVIITANWSQDGSRATPIVTYEFIREFLDTRGMVNEDGSGLPIEFKYVASPVINIPGQVTRLSARGGALLKSKTLFLQPETIRAIGGDIQDDFFPENYEDAAVGIATERVTALVDQNAFGPQMVQVRARDTVGVRALTVGSWVVLEAEWIPNLAALRRGGAQLALIIRRQKDPGLAWDMTMILAGSAAPGLDEPEVGEPEVGDSNQVCLYVTVPDDYEIEESEGGGSIPPGGEPPAGSDWFLDPSVYANTAELLADSSLLQTGFTEQTGGATGTGITINPNPPAGSISSKTIRFTYVRGANGCTSITLQLSSIRLGPSREMWVEFRLRWSPDFSAENALCPPGDHKLFFVDTVSDESGRWAVYVAQGIQVERPRDPDLGPGEAGAYAANLNSSPTITQYDMWDGNWHLIRFYIANSTTTTSDDGAMKLWVDGRLLHNEFGFNTCKSAADGNGTERADGVSFSHNQDDGPPNLQMELDWDYVSVKLTDPGW